MMEDVRLKVRFRLRELIRRLTIMAGNDERLIMSLRGRPPGAAILDRIKETYRQLVSDEFPGCTFTCTPNRIYVMLPAGYPASGVPISEPYPSILKPALFGLPKPFVEEE